MARDAEWRRAQRQKKIKERKKKLYDARGGQSDRWWVPGPEHVGELDKGTVYVGPHDAEDKESNKERREFRQTPEDEDAENPKE